MNGKSTLLIDVPDPFVEAWLEQIAARNRLTGEEVGWLMIKAGLNALVERRVRRIELQRMLGRIRQRASASQQRWRMKRRMLNDG